MVRHGLPDVLPEDATKRVISVLLIAGLLAIPLFRVSGAIWPIYALGAIAIVHMYLAASAPSAAATRATALIVFIVLIWLIWEVTGWSVTHEKFGTWRVVEGLARFQERVVPYLRNIAIGVWILFVLHVLMLPAMKADASGGEQRASAGLRIGAIVLGSWGLWAWLIMNEEVSDRMFSAVLLTLVSGSCLIVAAMAIRYPASAPSTGAVQYLIAFWLTVLTPIIYSAEFVIGAVQKALGHAMPKLLGRAPLHEVEVQWLDTVADFRAPIATASAILTAVMLVASALSQVVRGEATVLTGTRERIDARMLHARERINRLAATGLGALISPFMRVGAGITFVLVIAAYYTALLCFQIVVNVCVLITDVPGYLIRLVQHFLLPVLAASTLSFAIIAFIQNLGEYVWSETHGGEGAVWGEAVIVLLLVIALYLPSTGFNGPLNSLGDAVSRVALTGLMGFLIFSLIAAALAPVVSLALARFDLQTTLVEFGPLYRLNTIAVVGLVVAFLIICVPWLLTSGDVSVNELTGDEPMSRGTIVVFVALAIAFTIFSALAIRRGYEPMVDALRGAFQG